MFCCNILFLYGQIINSSLLLQVYSFGKQNLGINLSALPAKTSREPSEVVMASYKRAWERAQVTKRWAFASQQHHGNLRQSLDRAPISKFRSDQTNCPTESQTHRRGWCHISGTHTAMFLATAKKSHSLCHRESQATGGNFKKALNAHTTCLHRHRQYKADGPHNGRVQETDTFTETMAKYQLHSYGQAYTRVNWCMQLI